MIPAMVTPAEALRALSLHHTRCLLCRYLVGCRRSDRLLTAYHRATQAELKVAR